MTLKEQTIKRIEQQKEKIEEHKKEYGRVSLYDKLELKYLESVLKDLEVLEIFKSKCKCSGFTIDEHGRLTLIIRDLDLFIIDFEKIKRWLNDIH